MLQAEDGEFRPGIHHFRFHIAQPLQQVIIRTVERRLADTVANPVFRHVENEEFIVGGGAHVVVVIAQRLIGAGIIDSASLAP